MELSSREEKQPNKTKKIILILLVVSVIAIIIIIMLMMYLANMPEEQIIKKDKIFVDEQEKSIQVGQVMMTTDEGQTYLAIKELAELIGDEYYNGEYSKFTEDINKGYVENIVQQKKEDGKQTENIRYIVGLEANSNIIYKTNSESKLDYQYIEIQKDVLQYNNNLYISIDDVRSCIRNFS